MNMMVSAAAITAVRSNALTPNPDQELLELSEKFRALRPEYEACRSTDLKAPGKNT